MHFYKPTLGICVCFPNYQNHCGKVFRVHFKISFDVTAKGRQQPQQRQRGLRSQKQKKEPNEKNSAYNNLLIKGCKKTLKDFLNQIRLRSTNFLEIRIKMISQETRH